jgi:predicted nucleic acid-binding Zn ribbon protein
MPVFDVKCAECGRIEEFNFNISDVSKTTPCICDGIMHKRYAPVAVSFKGVGFYSTDRTKRVSVRSSST